MNKLWFYIFCFAMISCSGSQEFRMMDPGYTGIFFQNTVTASDSLNIINYEYFYNGAGVGAGDLNNDGFTDLVFAGNQVQSRVYLNNGDFRFRDITTFFTGLTSDQWYSGVALADVNNDGWLDVYLTSTAGPGYSASRNRLWINGGSQNGQDPEFTEQAGIYGIDCRDQSVAAAFFDYDLDGYLDLYVLNNEVRFPAVSKYRPKITDGTAPGNDRLYHNNGNGTFTDVTINAGITIEGFGMGLAISDLNKDGYPDIYISNDMLANDLLYVNQRNGTFRNEIRKYISYQSRTSKGNDIADFNNDGNPDIVTLDMMSPDYAKKKQTVSGFNYAIYSADAEFGFEHQFQRNMLHIHNGFCNDSMMTFSEAGQMTGVSETDWSWSPLFADIDNDGHKDLLITTGFPRDLRDKDWTKLKASAAGNLTSEKILAEMAPELKIPNIAFINRGDTSYEKSAEWMPSIPSFSYGAVTADLDNDGDLDYIVSNINDKAFILKNTTREKSGSKAHYLRVKLIGSELNPMATGSKVELWSNGKMQFQELFPSRAYASSNDPVIHFGLGATYIIDSIKVIWPGNNYKSVLRNVECDRLLEIGIGNASAFDGQTKIHVKDAVLFSIEDSILNYFHDQQDFNDFNLNQKVIPHKFSQIGPVMAKGDLDGDGTEDIIIGATNKLPTIVLLRTGLKFRNTYFEGLTTSKGFSESDIALFDYDGDGDTDVVAVAGGYENPKEEEYKHYIYENVAGKFIPHPLNVPDFPASVVVPCDFDKDGDLDLFIGSRIKKDIFPYANHSWILLNKNGVFSREPRYRLDLGMVTDALWADYDKDGWDDLIVAREWNSLVILKNEGGKELKPVILPELELRHGLWYAIGAGDLDGDGDPDLIAGNIGENSRFRISEKYPLRMYALDIEPDGIVDPIMTAYWMDKKGMMTEYPVNYLDELGSQSPLLDAVLSEYESFSMLSFKDLLPEKIRSRTELNLFVNTTSSYVLWNDRTAFRWERLPWKAQLSPLTAFIVKDFTGDKLPDIIVTGNDHSWDLETGPFDGINGLVMINRGPGRKNNSGGTFEVMDPTKSGFFVNGMAGSLLWLDGDTSIIVAGVNRSRVVTFSCSGK